MEIIYRANDGKEFTDEEECDEYEHSFLFENPLPLFIDKDFNVITSKEDIGCTERVQYILCRNKEEYDNMIALFDYLYVEAPEDEWVEGGGYCLWSWGLPNTCADGWVNVTKQIFMLEDICDRAADCLPNESEVK